MILDVVTASVTTGVPARTIRRWVLAGRIVNHGDALRYLVDPEEVVQLGDTRASLPRRRLP